MFASANESLPSINGQNSITYLQKTMRNNSKLDLIYINAYTYFGKFLSICSQDIKRKGISERNSDFNQGPELC